MESEPPAAGEAGLARANVLVQPADNRDQETVVEAPEGISTATSLHLGASIAALVSALALLALLDVLIYAELGHPIDLVAFLLALGALTTFAALVWRLHALYRRLDGARRQMRGQPAPDKPDALARLAGLEFWRDPLIRPLLAGAVVANLAVFAYVSARYALLPPFLPLHYAATGDVDRLGTPSEVFMMPGIGVVVLVCDVFFAGALYRRERLASCFLVGASIFVQVVLLVATANIVTRA